MIQRPGIDPVVGYEAVGALLKYERLTAEYSRLYSAIEVDGVLFAISNPTRSGDD